MSFGLYTSKIQSEVLSKSDALDKAYQEYPDANLYFCMVDLANSSNYRLSYGPEHGYVRGESFFSLVRSATRRYVNMRIIKEIGDASLICCDELRPLLEAGLLMTHAARQLAFIGNNSTYPFEIRLGIDFGVVKKISRLQEDYLGECIDRLARIMTVRSTQTNFLISEQAFSHNRSIVHQYEALCTPSGPIQLKFPAGKQINDRVIYRELYLNIDGLTDFSEYFVQWRREASLPMASERVSRA